MFNAVAYASTLAIRLYIRPVFTSWNLPCLSS
jgi:hypothetical protein